MLLTTLQLLTRSLTHYVTLQLLTTSRYSYSLRHVTATDYVTLQLLTTSRYSYSLRHVTAADYVTLQLLTTYSLRHVTAADYVTLQLLTTSRHVTATDYVTATHYVTLQLLTMSRYSYWLRRVTATDYVTATHYVTLQLLTTSRYSYWLRRVTATDYVMLQLLTTYPALVVMPSAVSDDSLRKFYRCYRHSRFPVITWRHPRNKSLLLRGAGYHGKGVMGMLKSTHPSSTDKLRNRQGQPATDAPPLSTMLTVQQKAQCVIWYAESKSIVSVRRLFLRTYPGQTAPDNKAIVRWFNQFRETGTVGKKSRPGRPRTSEENVERIRQSCVRSPKKSIARRSLQLNIPKTTIQNVLHKWLRLHMQHRAQAHLYGFYRCCM
ncbi:ARS-binding factor 1 [Homalodisca vitripennis]|nr:ARS-binding factor 1 [Homalodisca vitripennis]